MIRQVKTLIYVKIISNSSSHMHTSLNNVLFQRTLLAYYIV